MQTLTKSVWKSKPPGGIFNNSAIVNAFPDLKPGARRALVHRALQAGEIMRIRNGLYLLHEDYLKNSQCDPFSLAPLIYGPSYISFETALRFHGLIPEHVTLYTCGTSRRSRKFPTPLGTFHFVSLPCRPLMAGVSLIRLNGRYAHIATPFKAVADLIYRAKVSWQKDGPGYLAESLRIELDELALLDPAPLESVIQSWRNQRVLAYMKGLERELMTY